MKTIKKLIFIIIFMLVLQYIEFSSPKQAQANGYRAISVMSYGCGIGIAGLGVYWLTDKYTPMFTSLGTIVSGASLLFLGYQMWGMADKLDKNALINIDSDKNVSLGIPAFSLELNDKTKEIDGGMLKLFNVNF